MSESVLKRMIKTMPELKETRDVFKVHKKYSWGEPKQTSAHRNLLRYLSPVNDPDMDVWVRCEEWAKKHFSFMCGSKIDWDFEYCTQSLNQQSSPGFPYSRGGNGVPPFQKKSEYFQYQEGKYALENYHRYLEAISDKNYVPLSWYTCTVKKEMRKVKKKLVDDYRAYLAANVDNSAAGNAITLDMNRKFYASWATSSSFVGGSTFNGAWNVLFKRLSKHKNAFEMDVSAWDATLGEQLIKSLSRVMWSFVRASDRTEKNKIRWDNLFKEIYQSLVICPNGDVFFKTQGNPSGSFLTIVTNTIIHYMLFCYAWIKLKPGNDDATYLQFSENVCLALCGDDSLFTVSDWAAAWFHTSSITEVWLTLGIQAKYEATGEGPLIERQFLSQRTTQCGGAYVPYPEYDKVVSSMLWHTRAHLHIRWSYLKACALRMSSFFNNELRMLFEDYLAWLKNNRHYMQLLQSNCSRNKDDPFTFEEVDSVYKTDEQLHFLYLTLESQSAINTKPGLKNETERLLINYVKQEAREQGCPDVEAGSQESEEEGT
jgi:hypothetical protein